MHAKLLTPQNAKFNDQALRLQDYTVLLGALGRVAIVSAVHCVLDRAAHSKNPPLSYSS